MRGILIAALCAIAVAGAGTDPVINAWIVNRSYATAPATLRNILPDVHEVRVTDASVLVTSAGLSLHSFGPLEANQYEVPSTARILSFEFPRKPTAAKDRHTSTPLGIIGAFVTGVPVYNPIGTASWNDRNIWHRDAVASSSLTSPLLTALTATSSQPSPIIGFALDGFPIHGPFGPGAKRMKSSYRLRQIAERATLPDGTLLKPGQEGPPVSEQSPLGTFAEDYEYVDGLGDLDRFNGSLSAGTYSYFLATDNTGKPAWPYLIGTHYYGSVPSIHEYPSGLSTEPSQIRAGEPVRLILKFPSRFLETIHEQPIHLAVISDDLSDFSHIHPEPIAGDAFAVTHTFATGGHYRLYADYSEPGGLPRIARFNVSVAGAARAAMNPAAPDTVHVKLSLPPTLRTGTDIPLSFALSVNDLEPWLGSWAHIMIASKAGDHFVHAHPEESPGPHDHATPVGPSPSVIRTVTGFSAPGTYKIWFQYRREGKVSTVPFIVHVSPALASRSKAVALPQDTLAINVSAAGFEPSRLTLPSGREAHLAFIRLNAANCAREVVFPDLGIRAALPPGETTLVTIPASRERELHFACGMGMHQGALLIR